MVHVANPWDDRGPIVGPAESDDQSMIQKSRASTKPDMNNSIVITPP